MAVMRQLRWQGEAHGCVSVYQCMLTKLISNHHHLKMMYTDYHHTHNYLPNYLTSPCNNESESYTLSVRGSGVDVQVLKTYALVLK